MASYGGVHIEQFMGINNKEVCVIPETSNQHGLYIGRKYISYLHGSNGNTIKLNDLKIIVHNWSDSVLTHIKVNHIDSSQTFFRYCRSGEEIVKCDFKDTSCSFQVDVNYKRLPNVVAICYFKVDWGSHDIQFCKRGPVKDVVESTLTHNYQEIESYLPFTFSFSKR